jgi:molecular chaperone GrpE
VGLKERNSAIMGLKSKKVESDPSINGNEADAPRDADFSNLDQAGSSADGTAATDSSDSGNAEVAKLKGEVLDLRDKYLRALADFDNLKKRAQKDRAELLKYQGESILVDLLEVVDGFERALEYGAAASDHAKLYDGLKMIHKQFLDTLAKWEVRPETAMGKDFDPNKHRAIAKAQGERSGVIVGELKKPYFYRDKLLRVGEVVVSEAQGDSQAAESEEAKG